jgi:hypothetical protein|tara:strand:- start:559 stop:762 length:204 start_codon:yes stop_codon:yes gene_type:complete
MSPKVPSAPIQPVQPTPVRADQSVDLAPELVKANDADLDIKKKKVKKSGTSSLNTSSGLNIATNTSP